MSLCYLYQKKSSSPHRDKLLSKYKSSESIDIDTFTHFSREHHIYIVELSFVDKAISINIKAIFELVENPLIYFLIPKDYNLSLFQLAFMLNAKTIITANQNIDKVLAKLDKDYILHKEQYKSIALGENLVNHHSYLLFKDLKLTFASEQLLRDFACQTLTQVEEKICSKLNMKELLDKDASVTRIVAKDLKEDTIFFVKSITNKDETIISFEAQLDYEPANAELSYISTRVSFVELLKDKLLEKMISEKLFSILGLKVEKVSKTLSMADEENFRKSFLLEVELILTSKMMLAQYDTDLYVALFEDLSFIEVQDIAKNFHLQISKFLSKQDSKYVISLYALDVKGDELNPVLTAIESIEDDSIDEKLLDSDDIKYISNLQDNMTEPEVIDYMLDSIFLNTSNLSLLNIHNGMCINSSSKIIKKTSGEIYIKVENVQGIVMQMEKKVILQSSILSKSIRARVQHINIKEKYAILDKFVILDYDPNERQHGRVGSDKMIPIAISTTGSTIKGEIIDISATSIAIKVKKSKVLKNILNKDIDLKFYLDDSLSKSGSSMLKESATVIHESIDKDGFYKLICIFMENEENENLLIDHIFKRQKSIILDMKKMIV